MRLSRCLLSLVLLAGCSIDTEGSLDDTPTGLGGQAGVNTGGKAGKGGNNEGGAFPVGGKAGGAGMSGKSGQGGAGNEQGGAGNAGNEPGGAGQGGAGVNQGGAGNEPGGAGNAGNAGNAPGGAGQSGAGQGGAGNEPGGAGQGGAGVNQGGAGAGQGGAGNEPGGAGQGGAGAGGAGQGGAGQGGAGQGGAGMGGAGEGGAGQGGTGGSTTGILNQSVLWLDASVGVQVENDRVKSWQNRGTIASDALASDTNARPFIGADLNGKPVVQFKGAQRLGVANNIVLGESTVVVVASLTSDVQTLVSMRPTVASPNYWALSFSANTVLFLPNGPYYYGAAYQPNTWSVVTARASDTKPIQIRVNGSEKSDTAAKSLSDINGTIYVGGFESGQGFEFPLTSSLAELMVFDSYLSDADIVLVEAYLHGKWGF